MKPVIFIDFDDTLIYTKDAVRSFLENHYIDWNVKLPEGYICGSSFDILVNSFLPENKKMTREQFYLDYTNNFLNSRDHHKNVRPMPGTERYIPILAKKADLFLATARMDSFDSRGVVQEVLNRFFPDCFRGIYFVSKMSDDNKSVFINGPKKSFISSKEFFSRKKFFIDDNPREIIDVVQSDNSINCFLFDPHLLHQSFSGRKINCWEDFFYDIFICR